MGQVLRPHLAPELAATEARNLMDGRGGDTTVLVRALCDRDRRRTQRNRQNSEDRTTKTLIPFSFVTSPSTEVTVRSIRDMGAASVSIPGAATHGLWTPRPCAGWYAPVTVYTPQFATFSAHKDPQIAIFLGRSGKPLQIA